MAELKFKPSQLGSIPILLTINLLPTFCGPQCHIRMCIWVSMQGDTYWLPGAELIFFAFVT